MDPLTVTVEAVEDVADSVITHFPLHCLSGFSKPSTVHSEHIMIEGWERPLSGGKFLLP